MAEYGLTLVAYLRFGAVDQAIDEFLNDNSLQHDNWKELYEAEHRHMTVVGLVRTQTRPLSWRWLPGEFRQAILELHRRVAVPLPQTVKFDEFVVNKNGSVSLKASEAHCMFSDLYRTWNDIVDFNCKTQNDWGWQNAAGENLFSAKHPNYQARSTIGTLRDAGKIYCKSTAASVTVEVQELHLVHYDDRTLNSQVAEVVFRPGDRLAVDDLGISD